MCNSSFKLVVLFVLLVVSILGVNNLCLVWAFVFSISNVYLCSSMLFDFWVFVICAQFCFVHPSMLVDSLANYLCCGFLCCLSTGDMN